MGFRPRLLPTLITAVTLALLLGLGVWQLERQAWKTALIAELESRLAAPPVSAAELASGDVAALRYRRIRFDGTPAGGPFFWPGRTRDGEVGAQVLSLYAVEEGAALIVDRGWVPYDAAGKRMYFVPAASGPVEGVVRKAGWQGMEFLRPVNDPQANAWLYVDPAAMATAAKFAGALTGTFYVSAFRDPYSAAPPFARTPGVELPNNHLQYAITWFAVAAGVLAIYLLWHFRQAKSRDMLHR